MFLIPILEPALVSQIHFELKDRDRLSKDDALGSVRFKLEEIRSGKYGRPFWTSIYGAPVEAGNKVSNGVKE